MPALIDRQTRGVRQGWMMTLDQLEEFGRVGTQH